MLLLVLAASVYFSGLPVKVTKLDAAQYAAMGRQVHSSEDFFSTLLMRRDTRTSRP